MTDKSKTKAQLEHELVELRKRNAELERLSTSVERGIGGVVEQALRRSEENFRRSLDDSPLGVHIIDADGKTSHVNRAFLDLYGYDSIEKLNAIPMKERYTPESHAEHLDRMEKRRRGDPVPSSYEIDIVRKDGEIRHIQVFRKDIFWNGEPHFQVLYHDITDRKEMEKALRASEENYRRSLDDSPVGIRIFVPKRMTVYANRRFLDLFGCDSVGEFNATPTENRYTPEGYRVHKQRKETMKRDGFNREIFFLGCILI